MKIEKTSEIKPTDSIVMIVYGRGGVGKTTFAASAPKPLLLDFENGSKYLGSRGIDIDVARFSKWLSSEDKAQLAQVLKDYQTIIIDPLGEVMEKIIESDTIFGKKYRVADGAPTMAGWGEIKKQMRSFIKWLRDAGKNVIIISHVSEKDVDGSLVNRIHVATKLKEEIPAMVDIISYLGISTKDNVVKRILYTPTQSDNYDSKDRTGTIPQTVEISEKNGWNDLMAAMGAK